MSAGPGPGGIDPDAGEPDVDAIADVVGDVPSVDTGDAGGTPAGPGQTGPGQTTTTGEPLEPADPTPTDSPADGDGSGGGGMGGIEPPEPTGGGIGPGFQETVAQDVGEAIQRGDLDAGQVDPAQRRRAIAEAMRERGGPAEPFRPNAPSEGTTVRRVGEDAVAVDLATPTGRETVPVAFAGPRTGPRNLTGPREAVAPFEASEDELVFDSAAVDRLVGFGRGQFRQQTAEDFSDRFDVDLGPEDIEIEQDDGEVRATPTETATERIERERVLDALQEATPETRLSESDLVFSEEGAQIREDVAAGTLGGQVAAEQEEASRAAAGQRAVEEAERELEEALFGPLAGREILGVNFELEQGEDFTVERSAEGAVARPTTEFQRELALGQITAQIERRTGADLDAETDVELVETPTADEEESIGVLGSDLPIVGEGIAQVGAARSELAERSAPLEADFRERFPDRQQFFSPVTTAGPGEDIPTEAVEGPEFTGELTQAGEESVSVQQTPGSNVPVVGGLTTTVQRGRVRGVQATEPIAEGFRDITPSQEDLVGSAAAVGLGGLATPEPTTSAGGALVLGGAATAAVGADVARRTGVGEAATSVPEESATATAPGGAGARTDDFFGDELGVPEEQFRSELEPGEAVVESELGTPQGEPVDATELAIPEEQFPRELEPGEGVTVTELIPGGQLEDGQAPSDGGRGETVVPGEFPLAGRDIPADPTRDFVPGESERAIARASPVQEGRVGFEGEDDGQEIAAEDLSDENLLRQRASVETRRRQPDFSFSRPPRDTGFTKIEPGRHQTEEIEERPGHFTREELEASRRGEAVRPEDIMLKEQLQRQIEAGESDLAQEAQHPLAGETGAFGDLLEEAQRPLTEGTEPPFERVLEDTAVPGQEFTETATSVGPLARERLEVLSGTDERLDELTDSLIDVGQEARTAAIGRGATLTGTRSAADVDARQALLSKSALAQAQQQTQLQEQTTQQAQRQRFAQRTQTRPAEEIAEVPGFGFDVPERFTTVPVPAPGLGTPNVPARVPFPDDPDAPEDRRDDEVDLFDRRFEFEVTDPDEVAETLDRSLEQFDRDLADLDGGRT